MVEKYLDHETPTFYLVTYHRKLENLNIWGLLSSNTLRSVDWYLVTEVSVHPIGSIFKSQTGLSNTCILLWRCGPTRAMASSFLRFLDHTQRRNTVGRTPLYEWSARRRDLYLTTHNIHNRQISIPPMGFEPTISSGERPQTYALDRAATGTGFIKQLL